MHLKAVFARCAIDPHILKKRRLQMRRLFLIAAALALLVGVTGAYAWDQQATDDQTNYQSSHGQSLPTVDYPNEATGRY
jgi:ferric-dicitrate binding protein FerR (iron transport regulator)